MTEFEQSWYIKYMNNLVTLDTLKKLVRAGKLVMITVEDWAEERMEKYGY